MTLVLAVAAGLLIGLSLGALGAGGSILAVPALVYLLGQSPLQATTGSLVVVGTTSLLAAVTAWRAGTVRVARGLAFAVLALGGTALGARLSTGVPEHVLMAAFSALMAVVGVVMVVRLVRRTAAAGDEDEPIVRWRPVVRCACRRLAVLVAAATVVGLLTGFLGVGGGFLVVPALTLGLGLSMDQAVGTSLAVVSVTSASALALRLAHGDAAAQPSWPVVALLTTASVGGSLLGTHWGSRVRPRTLATAFVVVVLAVAAATAVQSVPALV